MLLKRCVMASHIIMPQIRQIMLVKSSLNIVRNLGTFRFLQMCEKNDDEKPHKTSQKTIISKEKAVPTLLSEKFEVFSEDNAPVILDMEEERRKFSNNTEFLGIEQDQETWEEEFREVDLTRGVRGVFDVEQLVDLLESDGAIDVFVAKLPEELRYAEHIVVVTGRSGRHRKALAQLVRRVFKKKRSSTDQIPRIEGDHLNGTNLDWVAMDLGNIILHIFARATRERYDLESLWTLGSKHDVQCNKPNDPLLDILTSHSVYLGDLEPAEPKSDAANDRNKNNTF